MIILLVGTGIFLTIRLKALPWRNLGYALKSVFRRHPSSEHEEGDISPFQSLMTALAATIGTGNIAGVATAMVLGGPGALDGCGSAHCSAFPPNMRKAFWRLNSALPTAAVKWPAAPCMPCATV